MLLLLLFVHLHPQRGHQHFANAKLDVCVYILDKNYHHHPPCMVAIIITTTTIIIIIKIKCPMGSSKPQPVNPPGPYGQRGLGAAKWRITSRSSARAELCEKQKLVVWTRALGSIMWPASWSNFGLRGSGRSSDDCRCAREEHSRLNGLLPRLSGTGRHHHYTPQRL